MCIGHHSGVGKKKAWVLLKTESIDRHEVDFFSGFSVSTFGLIDGLVSLC